ncbi:MAG: dihydrofolate reductase family protein, partial [Kiritimatiellae bacterium]|nr:dihydrofolate reductase family protein [Kiritimatiellia bacterium]
AEVVEIPLAFPAGTQTGNAAAPALDLKAALAALARGTDAMRVLCEGGPTLAGALLCEGLPDEISLFVAPKVLGEGGKRTFGGVPFDLPTAPRFTVEDVSRFGEDVLLRLLPRRGGHTAAAAAAT